MYQRKTLRRLSPTARRLAKTANALELEVRRLHALIPLIQQHEQVYNWVRRPKDAPQGEIAPGLPCPLHLDKFDPNCTACADGFFVGGMGALSARVMRDAPEVAE